MPDKKGYRAAVYCRIAIEPPTALYCRTAVSSNPLETSGIEAQKHRLLKYAKENGYTNPVLYIDNGESGSRLNRPAMKRLIADIKSSVVKTVIVTSADRIARSIRPMVEWVGLFKGKQDLRCISVDVGKGFSNEFTFWRDVYDLLCPVKNEGFEYDGANCGFQDYGVY